MRKTKAITQGAMFLAIIGAFLMIDRQFGFILQDLISIITPVTLNIYIYNWGYKQSVVYSVCLLNISVDLNHYVYKNKSLC